MTEWIANSEQTLQQAIGDLRELWNRTKYVRIKATTGRKRSLDQNAIAAVWYQQIAEELREQSVIDVKCECKLTIGVPILRAEDEDFKADYDAVLKRLTYGQKMIAMRRMPVTSIMTKNQLSQYLVTMQETYAGRVALTFPEPEQTP